MRTWMQSVQGVICPDTGLKIDPGLSAGFLGAGSINAECLAAAWHQTPNHWRAITMCRALRPLSLAKGEHKQK
jgi:hypothetical protein